MIGFFSLPFKKGGCFGVIFATTGVEQVLLVSCLRKSLVQASVEEMGCLSGVERGAVRGWGIVKRS